jgi:hypothetical protein
VTIVCLCLGHICVCVSMCPYVYLYVYMFVSCVVCESVYVCDVMVLSVFVFLCECAKMTCVVRGTCACGVCSIMCDIGMCGAFGGCDSSVFVCVCLGCVV